MVALLFAFVGRRHRCCSLRHQAHCQPQGGTNASAWETLGDQRSGVVKTDLGRGEMHAERVLVDADSVLDGGIARSSLERLGEQEHAAGEVARAQGA